MRLLPDTHLILWAYDDPVELSSAAQALMSDGRNVLYFSAMTIWEVAIKSALLKTDFNVDSQALRHGLLANGYIELAITGEHGIAVLGLPPIHKDPFDRILVAQATVEDITLLTADSQVAKYPGPIRKV